MRRKEIQTTIDDTMKYSGKVNIKVNNNGYVVKEINIHNEGNLPLFSFLVNCLSLNFSPSDAPKYIKLGTINGSNEFTSYSTVPVGYANAYIDLNSNSLPQVNYSFTIPATTLNITGSDGVKIDCLRLFSTNNSISMDNNYSAQITLNGNDRISVDPNDLLNITLLITWSLSISN